MPISSEWGRGLTFYACDKCNVVDGYSIFRPDNSLFGRVWSQVCFGEICCKQCLKPAREAKPGEYNLTRKLRKESEVEDDT